MEGFRPVPVHTHAHARMARFTGVSKQTKWVPLPLVDPWNANHYVTSSVRLETVWVFKGKFDSTLEPRETNSFVDKIGAAKETIDPVCDIDDHRKAHEISNVHLGSMKHDRNAPHNREVV